MWIVMAYVLVTCLYVCALWLPFLMFAYVCVHVVNGREGCYAGFGVAITEGESGTHHARWGYV